MSEQTEAAAAAGAAGSAPRRPGRLRGVGAAQRPAGRDRGRARSIIFDVADLRVFYGSFQAVADTTLAIREHEITALIGPSGCGKTTVLRCFNRMNDLIEGARVEGTIRYHGVDIYGEKVDPVEVRRRIGMVFQKPNPFPKSIYDNIAFGPRIAGFKGDMDDLVEESLHRRRPVGRGQGQAEGSRPTPCPAASSSACASPGPSPPAPTCCSWTSPARRWTPSPPCASRS